MSPLLLWLARAAGVEVVKTVARRLARRKKEKTMRAILKRFSEPSSWAGLAGLVAMAGFSVGEGLMQSIVLILAGACGVAAFFVREKGDTGE